jgi:hypothetical protein
VAIVTVRKKCKGGGLNVNLSGMSNSPKNKAVETRSRIQDMVFSRRRSKLELSSHYL